MDDVSAAAPSRSTPLLDELLVLMRANPPVNRHEPWSGLWAGHRILVRASSYVQPGEAPHPGGTFTFSISLPDFISTLRVRR